jgi:hypothetical protein
MSYTTTVMEEVLVISDDYFKEVDDLIFDHPRVIQSWNEAVSMAKALSTVSILKKKNGIK